MRRIVIFAAILVLQGILLAQTTEPQPEWLAKQATIRANDTPAILKAIQEIGGFKLDISADDEKLLLDQPLEWRFTNAQIKDILQFVLSRVGLSYKIVDEKTVQVVKPTL